MTIPIKSRCLGVIDPARWYTKEGLLRHCDIGGKQLREARSEGFLKAKQRGNRLYWSGAEVVRYLEAGTGK